MCGVEYDRVSGSIILGRKEVNMWTVALKNGIVFTGKMVFSFYEGWLERSYKVVSSNSENVPPGSVIIVPLREIVYRCKGAKRG